MTARTAHMPGDFVRTLPMPVVRNDAITARWNLHAGLVAEVVDVIQGNQGPLYRVCPSWALNEMWVVGPLMIEARPQQDPTWEALFDITGWRPPQVPAKPLARRIGAGIWHSIASVLWLFVGWLP